MLQYNRSTLSWLILKVIQKFAYLSRALSKSGAQWRGCDASRGGGFSPAC